MSWTGYLWPDAATIRPWTETAGSGPGQDRMAHLAQRYGVWIVYGFAERDGNRLFNAQGLAAPDGRPRPVYRKTHLFEADPWWAEAGDTGYLQWDSPWGRLGSGICMDLNYPDLAQWHQAAGTDILVFSTNWLDQGEDVLSYWEDHLAPFTGAALFANRGGEEFGVPFRGQSAVFVGGRCRASLPDRQDGLLLVDLEL